MSDVIEFEDPWSIEVRSNHHLLFVKQTRDDEPAKFSHVDYEIKLVLTPKNPIFEPGYFIDMSCTDRTLLVL